MPEIYDIDFELQSTNLDTPTRRLPKFTAFLYSLMKPLQWLRDLFYNEYRNGSSYALFSSYTSLHIFNVGDRVLHSDKRVYECIAGVIKNFTNPTNTNEWLMICDNFIGLNERQTYNSQIIKMEYQLNKWYFNLLATDQIYIVNNPNINTTFVMGNNGAYSSTMPVNSVNSLTYMGNVATYNDVSFDYTIMVPAALFVTLGTSLANRENNIRSFVDQFNMAGIKYKIDTYY